MALYLASQSPRRAELLQQLGVSFEVFASSVDETPGSEETPLAYVERLALAKAQATAAQIQDPDALVLGSDTSVVLGTQIFGKPSDEAHCVDMLLQLSGKTHEVITSVALVSRNQEAVVTSRTQVTFATLAPEIVQAYWRTGEPADKAGGYAIQGRGAVFVERIEGSYSGVMGLPLFETSQLLRAFGISAI